MDHPSSAIAFTIAQVMARVGIGRDAIYRAIKDGRLPAHKFGRRTLIVAADLENFLEALPPADPRHFVNPCPRLSSEAR
jgi:excisionase family DNA binding protein